MTQSAIQTECYSSETLLSYWEGRLEEQSLLRLEEHLQDCKQCAEQLSAIESRSSNDLLVAPLRSIGSEFSHDSHSLKVASRPEIGDLNAGFERQQLAWNGKQIGPYQLIRTIGAGGMGTVFLAKHTVLHRSVALKLLHLPRESQSAINRFEREILAIGKMNHPSIVAATDAGKFIDPNLGELQYLAMEYIEGSDLSRIANSTIHLTIADVAEIGRQTALALSYAHRHGVVHRDIKPSNIMLDGAGQVKVLDFGLAQFDRWDGVQSELTTVGQFLGTLDYMAPEQAERCGDVDYRADLYSLGATLFRLLCGHAPLAITPNQSPLAKLRLLANHRSPRLQTMRPDAPESIASLVDSLLETDPANRPISAAHVAEVLVPIANGSELEKLSEIASKLATPPSPINQGAPFHRFTTGLTEDSQPSQPQTASQDLIAGGRRRWFWPMAIFGAALPLGWLLGLFITFETQDGLLVIDSELPETAVTIKKLEKDQSDGQEQILTIETGNTVTRLRDGEYSLEFASPSTGIQIENGRFHIVNGQTVIARVRTVPKELGQEKTTAESLPTVITEAGSPKLAPDYDRLYEGKTTTEWMDILKRETNSETWAKAAVAVGNLLKTMPDDNPFLMDFIDVCFVNSQHAYLDILPPSELIGEELARRLDQYDGDQRLSLLRVIITTFPAKTLGPVIRSTAKFIADKQPTNKTALELALFCIVDTHRDDSRLGPPQVMNPRSYRPDHGRYRTYETRFRPTSNRLANTRASMMVDDRIVNLYAKIRVETPEIASRYEDLLLQILNSRVFKPGHPITEVAERKLNDANADFRTQLFALLHLTAPKELKSGISRLAGPQDLRFEPIWDSHLMSHALRLLDNTKEWLEVDPNFDYSTMATNTLEITPSRLALIRRLPSIFDPSWQKERQALEEKYLKLIHESIRTCPDIVSAQSAIESNFAAAFPGHKNLGIWGGYFLGITNEKDPSPPPAQSVAQQALALSVINNLINNITFPSETLRNDLVADKKTQYRDPKYNLSQESTFDFLMALKKHDTDHNGYLKSTEITDDIKNKFPYLFDPSLPHLTEIHFNDYAYRRREVEALTIFNNVLKELGREDIGTLKVKTTNGFSSTNDYMDSNGDGVIDKSEWTLAELGKKEPEPLK